MSGKCEKCGHSLNVHEGDQCYSGYDGMTGDGGCTKGCELD